MFVESLTYADLAAHLKISREAARSLARRRALPRSRSDDGKALVSVDCAELRYAPRPRRGRQANHTVGATADIVALKAEIARLEATAADYKADFERERERADHLAVELLQAAAGTIAANEWAVRLEGEVAALRTGRRAGGSIVERASLRLGHLAATIVKADRAACR